VNHERGCRYVAAPVLKYWCPVCVQKGFETRAQYDQHADSGEHVRPIYLEQPEHALPPADGPHLMDKARVVATMRAMGQDVPACMMQSTLEQ